MAWATAKGRTLILAVATPGALFLAWFAWNISAYNRADNALQTVTVYPGATEAEIGNLLEAFPRGTQSVAETGAAIIAAGSARYFGADIRRSSIVPIFVHNPTAQEVAEEGMQVPDNPHVSQAEVEAAPIDTSRLRYLSKPHIVRLSPQPLA